MELSVKFKGRNVSKIKIVMIFFIKGLAIQQRVSRNKKKSIPIFILKKNKFKSSECVHSNDNTNKREYF